MRIRPAFLAAIVKRLLGVRRIAVPTAEGTFDVDPASDLGLRILQEGIYDPTTLEAIKATLRPGDTFVDVGANEGYFAVVASRCVGPLGRVLAIEPQARIAAILRHNFELNHCSNVRHIACAVSDRAGTATLHLTPTLNNSASSLMRPTRYPLRHQTVELRTLEQIFDENSLTRCDLMKIDIESWEHEAILGSEALFRTGRVRALIIELHERLLAHRGLQASTITEFLSRCGYVASASHPGVLLAPSLRQ